jgi:precorrin-2 methylase
MADVDTQGASREDQADVGGEEVNWLRRYLARREANQKARWNDCAWSPDKFAKKELARMIASHHMTMLRMEMDIQMQRIEAEYREAYRQAKAAKEIAERQRLAIKAETDKFNARCSSAPTKND